MWYDPIDAATNRGNAMREAEQLNISWEDYCNLSAHIATNDLNITVEEYIYQKNNPAVSLLDIIKGWFQSKRENK